MATSSNYDIRVRGSRKATYAFYGAIPSLGWKEICYEFNEGEDHVVYFNGNCAWSLCASRNKRWDGKNLDLSGFTDEELKEGALNIEHYNLNLLSQLLHVEVFIHAWSETGQFESVEHIDDGLTISCESVDYYDPADGINFQFPF